MCGCDWVYSTMPRVVGADYEGREKPMREVFSKQQEKRKFEIVSALTIDYLYFQFLRLF